MSYAEGFEDAIELCLHELNGTTDLDSAKSKIERLNDLVKEKKFDRIKYMILSL